MSLDCVMYVYSTHYTVRRQYRVLMYQTFILKIEIFMLNRNESDSVINLFEVL